MPPTSYGCLVLLCTGILLNGYAAALYYPKHWSVCMPLSVSLSLSLSLTFSTLPYCTHRIGESFGVEVNFDPKPQKGDWNGAGCHTNFCIKPFHEDGGYESVVKAIKRLEKKHLEHIKVYGEGNERRLTGRHETAPIDKFSWGVAHRGASIRVPR